MKAVRGRLQPKKGWLRPALQLLDIPQLGKLLKRQCNEMFTPPPPPFFLKYAQLALIDMLKHFLLYGFEFAELFVEKVPILLQVSLTPT